MEEKDWENNTLTCDNFKEMVEKSKKELDKNVIILPPKEFYELQQIIVEHKEMKQQLQAYKDRENKLRDYIESIQPIKTDGWHTVKMYSLDTILQILNEGDK